MDHELAPAAFHAGPGTSPGCPIANDRQTLIEPVFELGPDVGQIELGIMSFSGE